MTELPDDRESILVDISGLRIEDILSCGDSPLLLSLRRLSAEAETEPTAGFGQGLS